MVHPEISHSPSFCQKLLHSFQSKWAQKTINSQGSCRCFLWYWNCQYRSNKLQNLTEHLGINTPNPQAPTNALFWRISTECWVRSGECTSRSILKCILRCTRRCQVSGLWLRNFNGFWVPSALPLWRLTVPNHFLICEDVKYKRS